MSAEVKAANGISVNGISVNGISVNGTSMNGTSVNGISVNGISVNGTTVYGAGVSGSQLHGIWFSAGSPSSDDDDDDDDDDLSDAAGWHDGADLTGARMTAELTNGGTLELRIDSTRRLAAPNSDLRSYTISYETSSGWQPLCPGTNEAIMFPGIWNLGTIRHEWSTSLFSLACRGATIAKCAELGYKQDNVLDTYHQTCVRAIRADYCGDGTSYTITGTEINIYDKLGRQADTQSWPLESNWTPDGATCINKARVLTSLSEPEVPHCVAQRAQTTCPTSGWQGQVLLRTEVNK